MFTVKIHEWKIRKKPQTGACFRVLSQEGGGGGRQAGTKGEDKGLDLLFLQKERHDQQGARGGKKAEGAGRGLCSSVGPGLGWEVGVGWDLAPVEGLAQDRWRSTTFMQQEGQSSAQSL